MKQVVISHSYTNRESESFNLYLKDIYNYEILTPTEEIALATKANAGDEAARQELVKRNLRFVVSVAKQYANSNNLIEDLTNEGNIGLIIASEKFKPEMGFKFISYAVWWIQKIICQHLEKHGRMVRLPANKILSLSKLDKKVSSLEQKLGRSVDIQEVIEEYCSEFDTSDFAYIETIGASGVDSLDRPLSSEDDFGTTLGDMLSDDSLNETDHLVSAVNLKEEIVRIISSLKPRDKRIMTALYGLDGSSPMTLKEVGDEIGVTREMIRQIKVKTLKTLKAKLANSTIRTYC